MRIYSRQIPKPARLTRRLYPTRRVPYKRSMAIARTFVGVVLLTCLLLPRHCVAAAESPAEFARADAVIDSAIERGLAPGAVLLVGRQDRTLYRRAYGARSLLPQRAGKSVDTGLDLGP